MPLPELLMKQASQILDKYCRERVPCERYQGLKLDYSVAGNHVTLFEEWQDPANEDKRLRSPIARFSYSTELNQWTLFSIDHQLRWRLYLNITPSLNLLRLVQAVDDDITGVFWGSS